jgi:hypothetical protein
MQHKLFGATPFAHPLYPRACQHECAHPYHPEEH